VIDMLVGLLSPLAALRSLARSPDLPASARLATGEDVTTNMSQLCASHD
jgi:hypothetical protein